MSIVWPITAFVALGFEHSIANMYFIPMGLLLKGEAALAGALGPVLASVLEQVTWQGFLRNRVPVGM